MGSRFSALYLLGAILVTVSGSLAGTTRANFTDTAAAGTATFTTGTVDLQVTADTACSTGYSDSISVPVLGSTTNQTNKMPGDVITGQVCIKNVGSLDTRWALTGQVSDDASGALQGAMKIRFWALSANTSTSCVAGLNADGSDTVLSTGQTNIGQLTPTPTNTPGGPTSTPTATPAAGTPTVPAVPLQTSNIIIDWDTQYMTSAGSSAEITLNTDAHTQIATGSNYQKLCFSLVLPEYTQLTALAGKTLTMAFTISGNSL